MRKQRLYSLFSRQPGEAKWHRETDLALKIESARQVFQSRLLLGSLNGKEMALRVVKR